MARDGLWWDPSRAVESAGEPSAVCTKRVQKELKRLLRDPIHGIHTYADDDRADLAHVLMVGPPSTPYDGGLFYFLLWFPPSFPADPPKVRLMTTGGGRVRFNPNLYADGKVCLSVLGTFTGPSWSPALGIRGTLMSIQSLLSADPWENEPDIVAATADQNRRYNDSLMHETIRVAVLGMADSRSDTRPLMPAAMEQQLGSLFLSRCDALCQACEKAQHRDGQPLMDLFGGHGQERFRWKQLRRGLQELRASLGGQPLPTAGEDRPPTVHVDGTVSRAEPLPVRRVVTSLGVALVVGILIRLLRSRLWR